MHDCRRHFNSLRVKRFCLFFLTYVDVAFESLIFLKSLCANGYMKGDIKCFKAPSNQYILGTDCINQNAKNEMLRNF